MSIIIPANSAAGGGVYDVANSLMFNGPDSANMTRSASGSSATKSTFSFWVKRSKLADTQIIHNFYSATTTYNKLYFDGNDQFIMKQQVSGSTQIQIMPSMKFRDTSAWYHIVYIVDPTESTEANRVKVYVNGIQITSFGTSTYPAEDAAVRVEYNQFIGREYSGDTKFFNGYLAEFVFLDGVAASIGDLGEFDEDSGIWKPIDVSGLTFGSRGFYLDFEDSSALGNDAVGSNNFTANNLAATDQATDTCTNNFATMNIIDAGGPSLTFSNGNTTIVSSDNTWRSGFNTIAPSKGKWYFEAKYVGSSTNNWIGVVDTEQVNSTSNTGDFKITDRSRFYGISQTGQKGNNGSESNWGSSYSQNDIVGVAFDLDNHKIYFSKDGTFQNSGNPESGATGTGSMYDLATGYFYMVGSSYYSSSASISYNFGSPYFAISSGNSDADGHGNFEYAVPSGYFALCTKNLAEYG